MFYFTIEHYAAPDRNSACCPLLQKKLKQWFLKPYNMERLTMNFYQ